jgi:hypothetical protein
MICSFISIPNFSKGPFIISGWSHDKIISLGLVDKLIFKFGGARHSAITIWSSKKKKKKQAVENTTSENVRLANKMDGREEYWRNAGENRNRIRRRRRERIATRGTGIPVKKWKDWEQKGNGWVQSWRSERDKAQTSKREGRESKNQGTTGCMRGVWQRKFRSTYLGRESARETKMVADSGQVLDGRKEKKVQDVLRRERERRSSTCTRRMDAAKWEREQRGDILTE